MWAVTRSRASHGSGHCSSHHHQGMQKVGKARELAVTTQDGLCALLGSVRESRCGSATVCSPRANMLLPAEIMSAHRMDIKRDAFPLSRSRQVLQIHADMHQPQKAKVSLALQPASARCTRTLEGFAGLCMYTEMCNDRITMNNVRARTRACCRGHLGKE